MKSEKKSDTHHWIVVDATGHGTHISGILAANDKELVST
jgi:hypothetical protein